MIWATLIFKNRKQQSAQPIGRTVTFMNRPLELSAAHSFRKDISRTGRSPETLRTPVRLFKRVAPLNLDIHSASKSSPVADASGLYFGTDSGRFIKVTWQGDIAWEYKIGGTARGIHGSAVVADHDVWFGGYNGQLYRLNKHTGEVIWMTNVGETVGSSPLLVGRTLYVTVEWNERPNGGLVKVDAESGQILWQSPLLGEQIHSSPAYDELNRSVVFGSNHGVLFSYSLEGQLKWTFHTGDAIKSTPAIFEGRAYVTSWDGFLYAIDGSTGRKIWKAPLHDSSQSSPTIIPELERVIVGDDEGFVRAFRLSDGSVLWSEGFNGQITGSATAFRSGSDWRIAIGCQRRTLCILTEHGKIVQELESRSEMTGEPGVFNGKLFAISDRDGLWLWE